jgi:hypothetical protein
MCSRSKSPSSPMTWRRSSSSKRVVSKADLCRNGTGGRAAWDDWLELARWANNSPEFHLQAGATMQRMGAPAVRVLWVGWPHQGVYEEPLAGRGKLVDGTTVWLDRIPPSVKHGKDIQVDNATTPGMPKIVSSCNFDM